MSFWCRFCYWMGQPGQIVQSQQGTTGNIAPFWPKSEQCTCGCDVEITKIGLGEKYHMTQIAVRWLQVCCGVCCKTALVKHKISVTFVFLVMVGDCTCEPNWVVLRRQPGRMERTIMFHILVTCVVLPFGLPHQCFGKIIANHMGVMWDETFNQVAVRIVQFKCERKWQPSAQMYKCCDFRRQHCSVTVVQRLCFWFVFW